MRYAEHRLFPPYAEKAQAGLDIADCRGVPIYDFRYPQRRYANFASLPPLVVQSLLFIENRDLLDHERPYLNPAVDWGRFTQAALSQVGKMLGFSAHSSGGSTLATQIEKYRHSAEGRTGSIGDKLRQMLGQRTQLSRRPGQLRRAPGHRAHLPQLGAAVGGAGLRRGHRPGRWPVGLVRRRLPAGRRGTRRQGRTGRPGPGPAPGAGADDRPPPAFLLSGAARPRRAGPDDRQPPAGPDPGRRHRGAVTRCGAGAEAGVPRPTQPADGATATDQQGRDLARTRLAGMLGVPLYDLDRLDLRANTTLQHELQESVTAYLQKLADRTTPPSSG